MNTYVAVNRSALRHNLQQAQGHLDSRSRLLAVVKANAYGHGLVLAARTFADAGAAWLGVSTVAEGVALREAVLDTPTLVFLPPCGAEELEALVEHRLTGTLVAVNQLHDLARVAQSRQRAVTCHVYMDTGLSRLGSDDSLPDLLDALRAFPIVSATGIYSHQGPPGSGVALADLELLREGGAVKGFLGLARNAAAQFAGQQLAVHLAASRLFLEDPSSHADLVRLGTLLYGQYPDDVKARPLQLRDDTFSLRSRIIAVQTVEAGARIGYGGEFVTRRETRVGTVPVGIAHGLEVVPRSVAGRLGTVVRTWQAKRAGRRGGVSGAPVARLEGRPAPLLGRVSMDQCCVDLTDLPEVGVGAEVALPARRLMVSASVPRVAIEDPE